MKAIDYFQKIQPFLIDEGIDFDRKLVEICNDFLLEAKQIISDRNIKRNDSAKAVFKEQELKFQSFANKVNQTELKYIKLDGFKIAFQMLYPDLYKSVYQ